MCIDCKYYQGKCTNPNDCANKKELEQIRADVIEEVIKKLAESEDTILSDRQYYTLIELKEQN